MRIERNHPAAPAVNLEKPAPSVQPATARGVDATAFEDSQRLTQTLAATANVRADQVARAKALIADPSYPSEKQLANVANLLASHLGRENAI